MATQKKKKTPVGKIILFVCEIIALVVLLVVMWLVLRVTDKEDGVEKITINEEDIVVNLPEEVKDNEVMKGYRNIALFGVDSRKGALTSKTRSDTIIIASINLDTKAIKLMSVYRDTYLNQMGQADEYGKCNASYAYGGAQQAMQMLNGNLDMNITDFVTIGFEGLKDVIDELGGVYIDVDEDEIKHINNYQLDMKKNLDLDGYTEVTQTGYQLLDGLQATAYCRIRYTKGNDFKRTERQREVIKACFDVAKTASPTTLVSICNKVFGEVYTSLDIKEILSLLEGITEYSIVDEGGFPSMDMLTTGTVGSAGSCVIPVDLEQNVVYLHEFLFNEVDYKPSQNVRDYSKIIRDQASKYVTLSDVATDDFGDE